MDERKRQVLRAIVALYSNDGEPIGSHLLSEYMDLAVSTATLRNEMAALTKLGLLEQPHTSAGRIPSGAGYRYYVDHLMGSQPLGEAQKKSIDSCFATFDYEPHRLVQSAAQALSRHTGLSVAATTPRAEDIRIVHYELTQIGRSTAAVLAVTSAGGVLTRVAKTCEELSEEDISEARTMLNRALCFLTPADVGPAILQGMKKAFGVRAEVLMPLAAAAVQLLEEAGEAFTAVEGISCLLRYPELSEDLPPLLELLDDEVRLAEIAIPATDRTTVVLGSDENAPLPMGAAVMAKRYTAGNGMCGGIAVIGSERMPYLTLGPILDYYALLLGQAMSGSKEY